MSMWISCQVVADAEVRRCLDRRHARAGRSPRPRRGRSASGEPLRLTGRARMAAWVSNRRTGRWCGYAGSFAPSAAAPGESSRRSTRWMPDLCSGWCTRRSGYASKCGISARRAQASAIVTRRAETAPAGSVRRSRIERDPERGTPTNFVLASSSSNGTRIRATRITPSDRHRAASRRSLAAGQGTGGPRDRCGLRRVARAMSRRVAALPFPAGSVGPPAPRQGIAPGVAGRPGGP